MTPENRIEFAIPGAGRFALQKKHIIIGFVMVGLVVFAGILCLGAGFIGYRLIGLTQNRNGAAVAVQTEQVRQPAETDLVPDITPGAGSGAKVDSLTLQTLQEEIIPINDPRDLAVRLGGKSDIPLKKPVADLDREIGERETFWVTNVDTAENFQVETVLSAKTEHLYFWVESGLDFSQKGLDRLADEFENKIYPTNQEFFGSEWTPGVDEDPHLYVIYASGLGDSLAGYYASIDEYHPLVHEYSNAHETFMLNADNLSLNEDYTYNVLAHEFQHMIHWYRDRNETSWLNEGFSELATLLNGYRFSLGGFDYLYAQDPDIQLNDWPNDPSRTRPHYGSSFLFVTYFLDRFGNQATKALVADDLNGLDSVDRVLSDLDIRNPGSGRVMTGDDVFLDWIITNYLKDEYNLTDRYQYSNFPNAPDFSPTEQVDRCPTDELSRDVSQYGVDYIRISCSGDYQLIFDGEEQVGLLPEDPYAGDFAFWSNKGDQSNMRLTREFDLTNLEGPITLRYWTWYDLEEDYDYLYLETSMDGKNWSILKTPSGTDEDPSGNSYGWAYNGLSGDDGVWIQEEIDLSSYAGQKVQIRFEYVTDAAVHGEGFLLDEISIPEIGYQEGFEEGLGGWTAEGFVRIKNELPQTYRLALLRLGEEPVVEFLELDHQNDFQGDIFLEEEDAAEEIILVVTGTTRYTRQKADYQFSIQP